MRIRGWHVEGFGILDDYREENLPDGVVILRGPNEAGKSTLLDFVRSMLFGGEDGRRPWQLPRPPLRRPDGPHGGRLFVEVPDGVVTVERFARRGDAFHLRLPGGREGTANDLQYILGGADRTLFQSVFAFTLKELQDLKSLRGERLHQVIFSAGVTGAGTSARRVIEKLENSSRELMKVSAGRLFDLAADLKALKDQRAQMESQADAYLSLLRNEEALKDRVERLRTQLEELRTQKEKYRSLCELWPRWCELCKARERLERLAPVDSFPPDADQRLASLTERSNTVRKAVSELGSEIESTQAERDRLAGQLDDRLFAVAAEAQSQAEHAALQGNRLNDLIAARTRASAEQEKLGKSITELGPDWDEPRLKTFDVSLPARQEIREWETKLDQAAEAAAGAERNDATAVGEVRTAVARRDRAQQALDQAPRPDEAALEAAELLLTRSKADLGEMRVTESKRESLQGSLEEIERARGELETMPATGLPTWATPSVGLAAVALATLGIWRLSAGDQLAGLIALLFSAAVGLAALLTWRFSRAGLERQRLHEQRAARIKAKQADLENALAAADGEVSRLRKRIDEAAATLGVAVVVGFYELERKEHELRRQRTLLSEWNRANNLLADAEQALAEAQQRQSQTAEAMKQTRENLQRGQEEWQTWKQEREVGNLSTPGGVVDFFEQVRAARGQLTSRDQASAHQQGLETKIREWERASRQLLVSAGEERADSLCGESLIAAVAELRGRCREEAAVRQQLRSLEESLGKFRGKLRAAEEEERACADAYRHLLGEAGVTDENGFREKRAIFEERAECWRVIQECEKTLAARLGLGAAAEAARSGLATGQRASWEESLSSVEEELPKLQAERDQAIGDYRQAESDRRCIEVSSDLAAKEAEIAARREEFACEVRRWRVRALAKGLVERTLERFTRERQPAVHADASRFLETVSDGYYVKVTQNEEDLTPVIFDQDQRPKKPDQLSGGTAELLYLCLRLGLAAEFCRRSRTSVPLVMDDALVC